MKTNVSVVLTDEQRNALACRVSGKSVKRLITRREVNELVAGFFDAMLSEAANDANYRPNELSRVPKKYCDKSIAWQRGWLRGWDKVGAGRRF